MIWQQLVQWIGVELWRLPQWYTRAEIALYIGCHKSPSLISALERAVDEGMMESIRTTDHKMRDVIKYRISDEYRERQFEGAKNYGNR